jgi:hypothetical protein
MTSLRNHEGYFMMDHRQGNPAPDELVIASGLPAGAGTGLFEAPTFTCSHCGSVVIMNPNRQRERTYCRGCDHLLCDACGAARAAGAKCKTLKQVIDELMSEAAKQAEAPVPLLQLP